MQGAQVLIPGQGTRSRMHAATKGPAHHNEDLARGNEDPTQLRPGAAT